MKNNIQNQATKLLELLSLNLPDMLWIKDTQGTYIYSNKALCDGLLMAKDIYEPIGKNDLFFALRERELHKDNPEWHTFGELCFNSDVVVIKEKKAMKFEEYGNVKGKMLYLEVFKAPFYDESGDIIGTVGAGRDITVLKETENRLKSFNDKLEERVVQEVQKQQEQESMLLHQSRQAAMGEMLESIAHQWRQPLNIMGLSIANIETQLLLGDVAKEEIIERLEAINSNIRYLSDTIDDFRNFLNPYSKSEEYSFNPLDSLKETLKILDAQLKNGKIVVETHIENSECCLQGVENEFKQVLFIILNNAIDAIKKRKSCSEIEYGSIEIDFESTQKCAEVKISDNGGGISEELKERIFEPYFTTKQKTSGTGIGLYIAKNIVESRMSGSISVSNTSDGCSFSIKIPREDKE